MSGYVSPFNNAQIPTTTQSGASYNFNDVRVPPNQVVFQLSWPGSAEAFPIAFNTIVNDDGRTTEPESILILPAVTGGSMWFTALIINDSTSNSITVKGYGGAILGELPAGAAIQYILLNTNIETASSWQVTPMNVGVSTITNPTAIAGDGLGVAASKLYVQYVPSVINLSDETNNTLVLSSWRANQLYTFMFSGGTVVLPPASGSDIGKANIFKNLSNGAIIVQVPDESAYFIDINVIVQGATIIPSPQYGMTSITVLPDECVTIAYNGQVTLQGTTAAFLYSVVSKVNSPSALLQRSVIYLPTTPPVGPIDLDINTVTADVIFITDANQASPASGSYTYQIQYPIAKLYYFAMNVVNKIEDIPIVTITFGPPASPTNQVIISPLLGLVECYVGADGTVIKQITTVSGFPDITDIGGLVTIIGPNGLAVTNNTVLNTLDVEDEATFEDDVDIEGDLIVEGNSTIPTLINRSTVSDTTISDPNNVALVSDITTGSSLRADFNRINSLGVPAYTIVANDGFSLITSSTANCAYTFPNVNNFPQGFTVCLNNQSNSATIILTNSTNVTNTITMTGNGKPSYYKIERQGTAWAIEQQPQNTYDRWMTYGMHGSAFITSNQTFTVPTGVTQLIATLIGGGGGGGGGGRDRAAGGGGGSGGVLPFLNVNVTPAQACNITIGGGGGGGGADNNGGAGGATQFTVGATTYQAGGGEGGATPPSPFTYGGIGGQGGTNNIFGNRGSSGNAGAGKGPDGNSQDGGTGGASFIGGSGRGNYPGAAGFAGSFGGGGGGGGGGSAIGNAGAGGAGGGGCILIQW